MLLVVVVTCLQYYTFFVLFRMNENACFIKVLKNKKDVRDERIVMLLEYCLYYIV